MNNRIRMPLWGIRSQAIRLLMLLNKSAKLRHRLRFRFSRLHRSQRSRLLRKWKLTKKIKIDNLNNLRHRYKRTRCFCKSCTPTWMPSTRNWTNWRRSFCPTLTPRTGKNSASWKPLRCTTSIRLDWAIWFPSKSKSKTNLTSLWPMRLRLRWSYKSFEWRKHQQTQFDWHSYLS